MEALEQRKLLIAEHDRLTARLDTLQHNKAYDLEFIQKKVKQDPEKYGLAEWLKLFNDVCESEWQKQNPEVVLELQQINEQLKEM